MASAAKNYSVTPLFFQQVLEGHVNQTNDSILFDEGDSIDIDGSFQSYRSTGETFRDTMVDAPVAQDIMRVQNLTSITNHPKKESMFKKAINSVKQKVSRSGAPKFRPMTESQVDDSGLIPKVNP